MGTTMAAAPGARWWRCAAAAGPGQALAHVHRRAALCAWWCDDGGRQMRSGARL
jgi:hypothetical protein